MDHRDYQLLSSIDAAEQTWPPSEGRGLTVVEPLYLIARLLQLRARGLVRFSARPRHDDLLVGMCELTTAGRAALQRRFSS